MSKIIQHKKNGNYIRLVKRGFEHTTSMIKASEFESEEKASNFLKNCISAKDRDSYSIVNSYSPDEYVVGKNHLYKLNGDDDKVIQDFCGLCSDAANNIETLKAELTKVEGLLLDIEHYIELNNFNASQGYKLCKFMKDTRIRRRELKVKIAEYEDILKYIDVDLITKLHNSNAKLDGIKYSNRVLSGDVFDFMKN